MAKGWTDFPPLLMTWGERDARVSVGCAQSLAAEVGPARVERTGVQLALHRVAVGQQALDLEPGAVDGASRHFGTRELVIGVCQPGAHVVLDGVQRVELAIASREPVHRGDAHAEVLRFDDDPLVGGVAFTEREACHVDDRLIATTPRASPTHQAGRLIRPDGRRRQAGLMLENLADEIVHVFARPRKFLGRHVSIIHGDSSRLSSCRRVESPMLTYAKTQ